MSKTIVSYGAGTNSTAMLVGLVKNGSVVDRIVFADTGGERQETYAYIDYFESWLVSKGYPKIERVQNDGVHKTLEKECLTNNRLPSIAFGFASCSDKYKRRPFKKWLKNIDENGDATVLIGFDADEPHRADRGSSVDDGYKKQYPLIEWGWGRDECIEAITDAGLTLPGKSACFFCPNSKPREILALPEDLKKRAIAIETNAHLTSIKGLGRYYKWADLIRNSDAQIDMFDNQMPCGCYDGG